MPKIQLKLIITADDFGYCPQRNKAIKDLYVDGKISRATVIMNGRFLHHASSLTMQHGIPVGLHFNLTEGIPISAPEDVKSLMDPHSGTFYGKSEFRQEIRCGRISGRDVATELVAQLRLFQNVFSTSPTFVDGHQHVHVIPEVAQVLAPCLRSFGIGESRIPLEDVSECDWIQPASRQQFYADVCQNSATSRMIFRKHQIAFPSAFLGLSLMGRDMTIAHLESALLKAFAAVPFNDVGDDDDDHGANCELMSHPGYASPPFVGGCRGTCGPDEFSRSSDRIHELEFLQSKSLEKLFAKHGVRVLRSNMTPMEEWKKNPTKYTGTDNSNSFATFR